MITRLCHPPIAGIHQLARPSYRGDLRLQMACLHIRMPRIRTLAVGPTAGDGHWLVVLWTL